MEKRNPIDYTWILLKGMAMGAADVVPGVSGGTIAFISGIYEELITTIGNLGPGCIRTWKQKGFKAFWKEVNGGFLLALFSGIAISVVSLAKLISWLLQEYPVGVWSFFFGLVLASVLYVGKAINRWNAGVVLVLIAGVVLAYWVVSLPASDTSIGLPYLFLSGALAICAMILPGISGAFILVLLGSYETVLEAVHQQDLKILAVTALGALFGLLSFARLLKWMFARYQTPTLALLTGFILGSLAKIWPWKHALETRLIEGKTIVVREANVLPWNYEGEAMLGWALALSLLGFSLIFVLEKLASGKNTPH